MKVFKLAIMILFISFASYAQPSGGGPGGGGDPDVPLGGIELLIAAGAAFGAKRWFDKSKKK
jgi:hypothetical protein